MSLSPLSTLRRVITALDALEIDYLIGGSVASSIHGVYRITNDIDMVVVLPSEKANKLAIALQDRFYVDSEMLLNAIEHRSTANLIDLESFVKVDLFIRGDDDWSRIEFQRRVRRSFRDGSEGLEVWLASVEDMLIYKLRWHQMGGGVSDRQWNDILGMLRSYPGEIDFSYLEKWAKFFGLSASLTQVREEVS